MKYLVLMLFAISGIVVSHSLYASQSGESSMLKCPALNELQKLTDQHHNMLWAAPGGWISYSPSFASHPKALIAVEWKGVELMGQIRCVYRPTTADFPIILYYNHFVPQPMGYGWRQSKKSPHVWVCYPNARHTCIFKGPAMVRQQSVDQELDRLGAH